MYVFDYITILLPLLLPNMMYILLGKFITQINLKAFLSLLSKRGSFPAAFGRRLAEQRAEIPAFCAVDNL